MDRIAIQGPFSRLTYDDLSSRSSRVASYLLEKQPTRVGIFFSKNRIDFFEIVKGAKLAAIPTTIFPYTIPPAKLSDCMIAHRHEVIFVDALIFEKIKNLSAFFQDRNIILINIDEASYADLISRRTCPSFQTSRNPAVSTFTSGTTGSPKLTLRQSSASRAPFKPFEVMESDVHLVTGPLSHAAPLSWAMSHLKSKARIFLEERFDPSRALEIIESERITTLSLVPTTVRRLIEQGQKMANCDISSIRAVYVTGAPFPPPLMETAVIFFGAGKVFNYFGTSEVDLVSVLPPQALPQKSNTVGQPVPGVELQIRDSESGEVLEANSSGTLYVKTHRTNGKFEPTGDTGFVDLEGYLHLTGRSNDVIKSGGVKISLGEVEGAVAMMKGVRECAAVGMPCEDLGEKVILAVSLEAASGVTQSDILSFLRDRIDQRALPKKIIFVDKLPHNPAGKIDRNALKAQLSSI